MTKEFVWAIDEDGKPCKCFAKPENRGKGRCPHKFHAEENETMQQLLSRSKRKLVCQGIQGTVKWSVDDEGLMLLEPVNGYEGTLENTGEKKLFYSDEKADSFPPIKKIEAIGKIYLPENSSHAFCGFTDLTSLNLSHFDMSNVKNMDYMFSGCFSLTSLDVSNFDTSKVTDMNHMFMNCWRLTNLDLSNFDTHKVENMSGMFYYCDKLTGLDLSGFDTSKVTDMGFMFYNCCSLTNLDISNFDTSNATDMSAMFGGCQLLTNIDLSNFNTRKVTNMSRMFSSCHKLTGLNLSGFDTNNVANMGNMFESCWSLTNLDLSNFNMDKVENMHETFAGCSSLKKLNLSNLTNPKKACLDKAFDYCESLSNLVLPDDVEKRSNDLIVLSTLLDYTKIKNFCPKAKKEVKILLNLIEKSTGADLSKERQKLVGIPNFDIDHIALYKSRIRPVKRLSDMLKVLQAHKVTKKDLQTENFKVLKERGVMSDINAVAKGVPLEDILA